MNEESFVFLVTKIATEDDQEASLAADIDKKVNELKQEIKD